MYDHGVFVIDLQTDKMSRRRARQHVGSRPATQRRPRGTACVEDFFSGGGYGLYTSAEELSSSARGSTLVLLAEEIYRLVKNRLHSLQGGIRREGYVQTLGADVNSSYTSGYNLSLTGR
jgi:hypothetical protein